MNKDRSTLVRLTLLIILVLEFVGWRTPVCAEEPNSIPGQASPILPGTPQAWALATTAILTEHNHDRHDLLGNAERTDVNIATCRQRLASWWRVTNRAELLQTLQWLEVEGHRKAFARIGKVLSFTTPEQQAIFAESIERNDQLKYQMAVVRKHYTALGEKSLLGWDYSRYIMLCRWGYLLGYLSEQEAWDKIWPAAQLLQRTFQSWADLGSNYLIGRAFWSVQQTRKSGRYYYEIYVKLVQDPNSPWRQCPWHMPLRERKGEAPPGSE